MNRSSYRPQSLYALCLAAALLPGALGSGPASAACLSPPGDIDGSGDTNVADVACTLLTNVWSLGGAVEAIPECVSGPVAPLLLSDHNCDGALDTSDTVLAITLALELPLSELLDADATQCVDACEVDTDGDGAFDTLDCAPYDASIHPGAVDVCNGYDDNCDGWVDISGEGAPPPQCAPATVCSQASTCDVEWPRGADVVVSEVMVLPVADGPFGGRAWLEITNPTDETVDLNGWGLGTNGVVVHTVDVPGGLPLHPADSLVIVIADPGDSTGLMSTGEYAFVAPGFEAVTAEVELSDSQGIMVDAVPVADPDFPWVAGASAARADFGAAEIGADEWVLSATAWGSGFATPGGPNQGVLPGACPPGEPIDCDDDNPCSVDNCVPAFGCVHGFAFVDTDGDGTTDCEDACELDPNKVAPGSCGCGLSEVDADFDFTADCGDGCVVEALVSASCSGCHSSAGVFPDLHPDAFPESILGSVGKGGAFIVPGDPESSYFYRKLTGDLSPGEGSQMPLGGAASDEMVAVVHDWILQGGLPCGCSSDDSDGDGVIDCLDDCPDNPALSEAGPCGCDSSELDSDGDGTIDCLDLCPDDPEKTEPGNCGCGVTNDTDTDGDGTGDCDDLCPNDPNKTFAGGCGCGHADTDSDGDGIADCGDGCAVLVELSERCGVCHNGSGQLPDLTGAGFPENLITGTGIMGQPYVVPGDAEESYLYRKLTGDLGPSEGFQMPLGGAVDPEFNQLISDWIGNGAWTCGCGPEDEGVDSDGDGALDCEDPYPDDPTKDDTTVCDDFEAPSAHAYGAKVKSLLTGLPLTDAELADLQVDSTLLRDYIDTWLDTPQARDKWVEFFGIYFQQNAALLQHGVPNSDSLLIAGGRFTGSNTSVNGFLQQSYRESFGRTVLHHVEQGLPFNEVMSTNSYMLTTALMFHMSVLDDAVVPDEADGKKTGANIFFRSLDEWLPAGTPQLIYTKTAVPIEEALDPTHPNFMKVQPSSEYWLDCMSEIDEYMPPPNLYNQPGRWKQYQIEPFLGANRTRGLAVQDSATTCGPQDTHKNTYIYEPVMPRAQFNDWRLVEVRKPVGDEAVSTIFDYPSLVSGNELILATPKVGFFTTNSFLGSWETNVDNQARVTMNQTLIGALGTSFSPGAPTLFPEEDPEALDEIHAGPGTQCYACHQSLDPMRQALWSAYSVHYTEQPDPILANTPAFFSFGGVSQPLEDLYELGDVLANHDLLARGWVQKLCHWANSAPCPETHPAFLEVVASFKDSNYDFYHLVGELFASPLVTGTECIPAGTGTYMSISRVTHLCASLSNRMGIPNACGRILSTDVPLAGWQNDIRGYLDSVPEDVFIRGGEDPLVISDPTMILRATEEQICKRLSQAHVGNAQTYKPSAPGVAIDSMVQDLMGLPENDPRHDAIKQILLDHFDAAKAEGVNNTNSLRSTFMVACMSPTVLGTGL